MAGQNFDELRQETRQSQAPRLEEVPEQGGAGGQTSADTGALKSAFAAQRDQQADLTGTNFGDAFEQAEVLQAGTVIGGNYRIIKLIGSGGMGQVYQVEHLALSKMCALKVLPTVNITKTAWQRFQIEAKTISQMDHPNLLRVTDLGVHEKSMPYFAMEYIDGRSLAELIVERGHLSEEFAFSVIMQICDGMKFAHSRGVIHRDLKPANIMLVENEKNTEGFTVKILDFGLAKLTQKNTNDLRLTATGEIFGSPLYMSPEQCDGAATDQRSDIYSMGCTLFESLTGSAPFGETSAFAIMTAKINKAAPRLESLAPGRKFSMAAEYIVARMLQKNPDDRYQSIDQLAGDVHSAMEGTPVGGSNKGIKSGYSQSFDQYDAEAAPSDRFTRLKEGGAEPGQLKLTKKNASVVACLAFVCWILGSAINVLPFSPFEMPMFVPIPASMGPEAYQHRIQACDPRKVYMEANRPGIVAAARVASLERISAQAIDGLAALGLSAIPACVKDVASQTASAPGSARVLAEHPEQSVNCIVDYVMQRPDSAKALESTLAKLGPTVGSKLCTLADTPSLDKSKRQLAIKILADLALPDPCQKGTYASIMNEPERTILIKLIHSESDEITRKNLVVALSYFKVPTPEAVSSMFDLLNRDPSIKVQLAALDCIGEMLRGAAKDVSNDVMNRLSDIVLTPDQAESIKTACLDAIAVGEGNVDLEHLSKIRTATKSSAPRVEQNGLQILSALALHNSEYLPDLVLALNQTDRTTVLRAITITQNLGVNAKLAEDTLRKLAEGNDTEIAAAANLALTQTGG